MARILVVDDQAPMRVLLRAMLEDDGHEVVEATNGHSALGRYLEQPADLVITDIYMPEMNGLELIAELTQHFLNAKVIAMSFVQSDSLVFERARRLGARQILRKPFSIEEVLRLIRDELAH